MKFFTIAAIFVGAAVAQNVVYETEVVTITSCAPEKPSCPATVVTNYTPIPTDEPVAEPTSVPVDVEEPVSTDCPEDEEPTVVVPVCPGGEGCPPVPTGTGVPSTPANATTPVITTGAPTPSSPVFDGGVGKMGASLFAVAGAAALAILV